MKISDKLENFKTQGKTYYSFEFFPPKTDFGWQVWIWILQYILGMDPLLHYESKKNKTPF